MCVCMCVCVVCVCERERCECACTSVFVCCVCVCVCVCHVSVPGALYPQHDVLKAIQSTQEPLVVGILTSLLTHSQVLGQS